MSEIWKMKKQVEYRTVLQLLHADNVNETNILASIGRIQAEFLPLEFLSSYN